MKIVKSASIGKLMGRTWIVRVEPTDSLTCMCGAQIPPGCLAYVHQGFFESYVATCRECFELAINPALMPLVNYLRENPCKEDAPCQAWHMTRHLLQKY